MASTRVVRRGGYLNKKGANVKNWKRRYCALLENAEDLYPVLTYFEEEDMRSPKGSINLQDVVSVRSRCPPHRTPIFEVSTMTRNYLFQADSEEDMNAWISDIQRSSPSHSQLRKASGYVKQGILSKEGNVVRTWKTREFTLWAHPLARLTYGDAADSSAVKGEIVIGRMTDLRVDDNDRATMLLTVGARVFKLKAETIADARDWMSAIRSVQEMAGQRGQLSFKSEEQPSSRLSVKAVQESILRQGWMKKQGGSFKNWKRRFFVLQRSSGNCISLKYFAGPDSQVPLGEIPLEAILKVEHPIVNSNQFSVVTQGRAYLMQASDHEDAAQWGLSLATAQLAQ